MERLHLAPWLNKTVQRIYLDTICRMCSACEFIYVFFHVCLLHSVSVCTYVRMCVCVCVCLTVRLYAYVWLPAGDTDENEGRGFIKGYP